MVQLRMIAFILLCTACCLTALAGCNGAKQQKTAQAPHGRPEAEAYQPEADPAVLAFQERQAQLAKARELRLLDPRESMEGVPVAWDLSSDGSSLLALVPAASGGGSTAYSISLARPDLRPAQLGSHAALRAFIAASSTGRGALVSAFEELPSRATADQYWWLSPDTDGTRSVPYLKSSRLPAQLEFGALESRGSFVAAGDRQIIIPVGSAGVVVAGLDGTAKYLACPEFDKDKEVEPQGMSCGRLPMLSGTPYIYASQFAVVVGGREENGVMTPVRDEYCQISVLNLATLKWERTERFNWTVVEIGSPDFRTADWTLLGSRARLDTAEAGDRMARARRYSQADDLDLDLPLLNGLAWDPAGMHLTPDGRRVIYKDPAGPGIARASAGGGVPERDTRCYLADAKLLLDASGDTVLLVQDDIAVRCEFGAGSK